VRRTRKRTRSGSETRLLTRAARPTCAYSDFVRRFPGVLRKVIASRAYTDGGYPFDVL